MGDEADDIMTGFGLTDEEKMDYDVVKTKFDGHFVVRRNAIFERAKFSRRSQEECESVDSLITSLCCLAEYCEYGVMKEEMIRDRIVVEIIDTSLSLKLQMDGALTVKKNGSKKRGRQKGTNLATGSSSNVDVVQGQWQGARKLNKHSQRKTKHGRKFKTVNNSHRGSAIVAGNYQIT